MGALQDHPLLHLAFASLHVLVGHLGAALLHRVRFGRDPFALYRRAPTRDDAVLAHRRVSQGIALLSLAWAAALVASALSPTFLATPLGTPLVPLSPTLGWIVAVAGLVGMTAAQASMGAAFRIGQHERDAPAALRTGGLHAWSRNPVYLGSWTFLLGMALWSPSVALLTLTALLGVAMHRLVLEEERFLAARFPEAFTAWCRAVPRYLGWHRGR